MMMLLAEVVVVDVTIAGYNIASATDSSSVSPYMAYSSCTCDSYADCMNRCAKISSNILSCELSEREKIRGNCLMVSMLKIFTIGRAFHPNAVAYVPSVCERLIFN
jgi:hypothetical protein